MKTLRKIGHSIAVLFSILWRKYILRRKSQEPQVKTHTDSEKVPLSEYMIKNYRSFSRLTTEVVDELGIVCKLVDVDIERPCIHIMPNAYKTFMCDTYGRFNEEKASAFMENARFYVNFNRAYTKGMLESDTMEYSPSTPDRIQALTQFASSAWLQFIVYKDQYGSNIQYVGKACGKSVQMRPVYDDPELERMSQRIEYMKEAIEKVNNRSECKRHFQSGPPV